MAKYPISQLQKNEAQPPHKTESRNIQKYKWKENPPTPTPAPKAAEQRTQVAFNTSHT